MASVWRNLVRTAKLALLAAGLASAGPAFAAWPPDSVRYVRSDADGNGNGSSNIIGDPMGAWTLSQANAQATAGFTVIIGAGSYNTGIAPVNGGALYAPWGIETPGQLRFVGRVGNAQACSLTSVSCNVPYVTVNSVSLKSNQTSASVTLGDGGGPTKISFAEADSFLNIYMKRGNSNGVYIHGAVNCVVARCSLLARNGAAAAADGKQSIGISCDRDANDLHGCYDASITYRTTTGLSWRRNYLWIDRIRPSARSVWISGQTNNCRFDSNVTYLRFDSAGTLRGSYNGITKPDGSCIGWEFQRCRNMHMNDNTWIAESDGSIVVGSEGDDIRFMSMRDSVIGIDFKRDRFYLGQNYLNEVGTNRAATNIKMTTGQSGFCCYDSPTQDLTKDPNGKCGYANHSATYSNYGSDYVSFDSCTIMTTQWFGPRYYAFQHGRLTNSIIIATSRSGPAFYGIGGIPNATIDHNTFLARGGYFPLLLTESGGGKLTAAVVTNNLFYSDSMFVDSCSGGGYGGGMMVWGGNPPPGSDRNFYYIRKIADPSAPNDTVCKQDHPNTVAVADPGIDFARYVFKTGAPNLKSPEYPYVAIASGQYTGPVGVSDTHSLYGNPAFGYLIGDWDPNTIDLTTGVSSGAISFLFTGGYAGAISPNDNVRPAPVTLLTASRSVANDTITKTVEFFETGDDSLYGVADSVYILENYPPTGAITLADYLNGTTLTIYRGKALGWSAGLRTYKIVFSGAGILSLQLPGNGVLVDGGTENGPSNYAVVMTDHGNAGHHHVTMGQTKSMP